MKRRHGLAALCGAALWPAAPWAQLDDQPPPPGPPLPLPLPAIEPGRLPNGLQLLLVPRPGVPLVTATLFVRAGRASDPPQQSGLAQLTAGLLSKGARRGDQDVPAPQLVRQAEALGNTLEIGTGWLASNLSLTVIPPKLDAALALLADVVRSPLLQAEEVERLRTQTIDALRVSLASPGEVATLTARRAFWGASPYGASPTPASLQRIERGDAQAFHGRWFRPDLALLVLAGDLPVATLPLLLQRHFGVWPGVPIAPPQPAAIPAQPIAAPTVVVEMPGSGQTGVTLAAPFIGHGSGERAVADVALSLFGGGYSSRLNQAVRIRRGLSYGAFAAHEAHPVGGWISAQAQTNHPNAAAVAQVMRDELLRIGREEAPADELNARKAALVGNFGRALETTHGLAAQVGNFWLQGRSLAEYQGYAAQVLAVTPRQVREFAERLWPEAALRTAIATDPAAAGNALRALGEGVRRVPLQQLDLESASLVRG